MWKDVTTYTKSKFVKEPTSWEIEEGELKIVITKAHINWSGEWVMHCRALGMEQLPLTNCRTTADAKDKAIILVENKILRFIDAFKKIKG